jgi:hypothetical protein
MEPLVVHSSNALGIGGDGSFRACCVGLLLFVDLAAMKFVGLMESVHRDDSGAA